MDYKLKVFIDKFAKEIKEDNAAIFAGAGLSKPAGYVNWAELLEPIAKEIGLDISKEYDLVTLAQYYKNEKGSRSEVNRIILEEFASERAFTENHSILASLPISKYWTINYDSLIEEALKSNGRNPDVKYTVKQLSQTKPRRDCIVYKMHGDKEHPSDTIILKEDYETYSRKFEPFITALSGDLISKTFLFIGLSFTDPNLDYILSRIRINYGENQRTHYTFIKLVERKEYDSDAEFEYFKRKQELFLNDLKRYNIEALIIDDYSKITDVLKNIENAINQDNIFISGSAHTYSPWLDSEAKELIYNLSKRLIKGNNRIISGFGLGIGSFVISGALEEIYMNQKTFNDERLILRPFPQHTIGEQDIKELWKKYRVDMISKSGISIFMFGNKLENENIVNANGVYLEFEISKDKGKIIVPVGITGYESRNIWNEVNLNFNKYYPNGTQKLKILFEELNKETDKNKLVEVILDFIKEAKECSNKLL